MSDHTSRHVRELQNEERAAMARKSHEHGRDVIPPTQDEIAVRAYDIYVKNGRKEGQCKQNWERAEHELQTAADQL